MTLAAQPIHRYPALKHVTSLLDPLEDVVSLISALTSTDYLSHVLLKTWGLSKASSKARAKIIIPHVRTALAYVDQSLSGPPEVAFLPLYYALLNLAKVYILLGPHHAELSKNRWHGARYDGQEKDSHGLLTEEIVLKKGGAIPLLYRTITGHVFGRELRLQMSEVYPYLLDVSAEYLLAVGHLARVAEFAMSLETVGGFARAVVQVNRHEAVSRAEVRLLVGFTKDPSRPNTFVSSQLPAGAKDLEAVRGSLRPYLLYLGLGRNQCSTPVCSSRLLLPEEVPILLALFHMSSVARYKPEFLARLTDSRFWPMLTAAQRHCVLKFLILTWSYVHQETLSFGRG